MKLFSLIACLCCMTACHPQHGKKKYISHYSIVGQKTGRFFFLPESQKRSPPNYPHREYMEKVIPSVTKQSFRCKGKGDFANNTFDCKGIFEHGLPLRDNKEFVYPCLIDLLNYIIKKSGVKVTITEGHSCPNHKKHLNPESPDLTSKHLIGAAVTFKTIDLSTEKLFRIIKRYYAVHPAYRTCPEYTNFNQEDLQLFNKEVFVCTCIDKEKSLCTTMEVLYDRDKLCPIEINSENIQNYLRY
ncbi:MAG: hypothetical protein RRZ67_02520 [Victivallaceae bacterium]